MRTDGLAVPWAYTRRQLAQRWGIPPWEVDEAPYYEVGLELEIQSIEAKCQPSR